MSREVVIYSAGLDSTLMLYMAGMNSTKDRPVYTLSAKDHHLVNHLQYQAQYQARRRYYSWAKKQGHFIKPQEISVDANNESSKYTAVRYRSVREINCWTSLFQLYFKDNDRVAWGYKGNELSDRQKREFLKAMRYHDKFVGDSNIEHIFPLSKINERELVSLIKTFDIPYNCVFNCPQPIVKYGKIWPCGRSYGCGKCSVMSAVYGKSALEIPKKIKKSASKPIEDEDEDDTCDGCGEDRDYCTCNDEDEE